MLHHRIASDLRKHLSSVSLSPSSTEAEQPALASRLILLPATGPQAASARTLDRPGLLEEFVRISSHRVAAFLAEAAVLVLVFGILDRFLTSSRLELHWVGGAFMISTILLVASVALELSARLWLTRS